MREEHHLTTMLVRLLGLGLAAGVCIATVSGCRTHPKEIATREKLPPGLTEGQAEIRSLYAKADYVAEGMTWRPAKRGMKLKAGMSIRVGTALHADLFMGCNGPVIRLCRESSLKFDELTVRTSPEGKVGITRLTLLKGRLLGNVSRRDGGSYQVKTPKALLSFHGYGAYCACECGFVTVTEGSMSITQDEKQYEVHAGEWFVPGEQTVKKFDLDSPDCACSPNTCPWAARVANTPLRPSGQEDEWKRFWRPTDVPPLKRAF